MKKIFLLLSLFLGFVLAKAQPGGFVQSIAGKDILCLEQDKQGYLWIGTSQGLFRYNGSTYQVFKSGKDIQSLNSDYVNSLYLSPEGELWLSNDCGLAQWTGYSFLQPQEGTYTPIDGIMEINSTTLAVRKPESFELISKKDMSVIKKVETGFFPLNTRFVFAPEQKEIWLFTTDAVQVYSQDLMVKEYALQGGCPDQVVLEPEGNRIWSRSQSELKCYSIQQHAEMPVPEILSHYIRSQAPVLFLAPYAGNRILIGFENGKCIVFDSSAQRIEEQPFTLQTSRQHFLKCFTDRNQNVWIADKEKGLLFYPKNPATKTLLMRDIPQGAEWFFDIAFDEESRLWLLSEQRAMCYDIGSHTFTQIHKRDRNAEGHIPVNLLFSNSITAPSDIINAKDDPLELKQKGVPFEPVIACKGDDNTLWISDRKQIGYITSGGKYKSILLPEKDFEVKILKASNSAKRKIYIISRQNKLYEWDGDQHSFSPIYQPVHNLDCFTDDRNGNLWIGSFNEGLVCYNPSTQEKLSWDTSNGLPDNHVKNVIVDSENNIWISSTNYISRLTPQTGRFIYVRDMNLGTEAEYRKGCISPDGKLCYLGKDGISIIDPFSRDFKQIEKDDEIPLFLDRMEQNGNLVNVNSQDGPIRFSHQENSIRFYFSGICFDQGSRLNYSYKLEGYDKDWQSSGLDQNATYGNLPAGDYVFKARVKNLNGEWSHYTLEIPFTIQPAPWASWWAILLYIILFAGILGCMVWMYIRHKINSEHLSLVAREKEIAQEQVDFLANLSHELHTPLTLISAPLAQLQQSFYLHESDKALVNLALNSTDKLRRLSEQILATGKTASQGESKLKVRSGYLPSIIQTLVNNFRYIVTERDIQIDITVDSNVGTGYYDLDKVEKILSNLMSNAVKYTSQQNGEIQVHTYIQENKIFVSVKDNGAGIKPEKQEELFARFNRLSMELLNPKIEGNGIGLNYSQYLAHLHHGEILFQNRSEKEGSVFTLEIPYTRDSYAQEEICEDPYETTARTNTAQKQSLENTNVHEKSLLIVEDDADIREYLNMLFSKSYNVSVVSDGMEAFEFLEAGVLPDLVISDIVMPRKDGYQLCKDIRSSKSFSMLPVILLTGKNTIDAHLRSLNLGADAYLPKPFDPYILISQVENLISKRKRLQTLLASQTSSTIEKVSAVSEKPEESKDKDVSPSTIFTEEDKAFLEKIYRLLDQHLSDGNYNAASLAKDMGMSFNTLSPRLKLLVGETPHSFITTYRMNIALEMLREGKKVSEVCYSVGASALQNFSRTFKAKFGVPPTQFEQIR